MPLHTRSITVQSYERDDGQWDMEARLRDVKSYDFEKSSGDVLKAGQPLHDLLLRITFNEDLEITDAVAGYEAAPYGAICMAIAPDYSALIGMNLLRGFRQSVRAKFARTAGCTHMTELCSVLPTVAVQTLSRHRRSKPQAVQQERPFQLEGCHAYRLDGPVVREYYPGWYVRSEPTSGNESSFSPIHTGRQ